MKCSSSVHPKSISELTVLLLLREEDAVSTSTDERIVVESTDDKLATSWVKEQLPSLDVMEGEKDVLPLITGGEDILKLQHNS